MILTSSEMHLNAMFSADVLAALTQSFNIGYYYVGFVVAGTCDVPGVTGTFVGSVDFCV